MNGVEQNRQATMKRHFETNSNQLNFSIEHEFDDDDFFAIDKVAQTNVVDSSLKNYNASTITATNAAKKSMEKSSNISFNTLRDYNSEHSSLNSVNKESFCQNYINEFNEKHKLRKKSPKKEEPSQKGGRSKEFEKSTLINNSTYNAQANGQLNVRKMTPPGDVLATINKWLKKTKYAIELRNKQLEYRSS